jgi:hypothetical protein
MQAVVIRVKPADLSIRMAAMRAWLDEHRVDLSTFSCSQLGDGVLVRAEFRRGQQAAAFADSFGGRADRPHPTEFEQEDLTTDAGSAGALVG